VQFTSLRVRNYRSIAGEQTLDIPQQLTVVGPNNSGKTNLLRALKMFFTGFENEGNYDRASDLTFGKTREQTTLVATFSGEGTARDDSILDIYDRILALYAPERTRDSNDFQVQLIFSLAGNPTYRLSSDSTSKVSKENQNNHSRLLRQLIDELMSSFSIHYVPSSSNSEQLFEELVSPLLKLSVARKIRSDINSLVDALDVVSTDLSETLRLSGLADLGVSFGIPNIETGLYLSYFSFDLSDPNETSVFEKGRGIQALAMFACFAWIAEQERLSGLNSIWLIEEPESYLNPDLYQNAIRLIDRIGESAQVIKTTHALGMVPSAPENVVGSSLDGDSRTHLTKFVTAQQATSALRASLGVRFSDYFGLSEANVFTEGESDIKFITWAASLLGGSATYPKLSEAGFRSFGGTTDLAGFLKANYSHIRPERAVVTVLDGDAAGVKVARDLAGYLGNKGSGFQANVDYVIVRSGAEIEGLFPDSFLKEAFDHEPRWFESWITDASGELVDFAIRDASKRAVGDWLIVRCEAEDDTSAWSERWQPVLESIERALSSWRAGRK
jgi:putative ATP-dependent endonuclease of OLD family